MPLVPLGCAWMLGVLLGTGWPGATPDGAGIAAGAAVGCAGALALVWPHRGARWVALALLAGWLGLARGLLALPPAVPDPQSLRALNVPAADARSVLAPHREVRGRVLADPDPARAGRAAQVRVAVEAVLVDGTWRPVTGGLLAVAGPFVAAVQGDLVECVGVVQDPPALPDFDYRAWLARHGIESYMDGATVRVLQAAADAPETLLARWRRDAGLRTAAMLPEPEAGLLRGLLLGQQKAIDPPLWQDFNTTGTSWLIVISGAQITMLLLLVYAPARRVLYPWPSVLLAGAVVVLYSVFVGLGVPVARAAVMGVLYLGAQGLGRPVTPINLLAVAALALTALDPNVVADAGFQLSFAAVAGIVLFGPALMRRWRRVPVLGDAAAFGIAAQLTTWPIVVLQFGQVSLTGFPAGMLTGLLVGPLMVVGTVQQLAAWLWAPLGQVLAWVCWPALAALAYMIRMAAQAPGIVPLPDLDLTGALAWYGFLALVYLRMDPERWAATREVYNTSRKVAWAAK
jgi:competence protein ComEC